MDPLLVSIRDALGEVRVVAEQPRRHSRVLRLAAARDGGRLFVKQVKLEGRGPGEGERLALRVRREYEILRRVHDGMPRDPRLGCVRPVACFPEHLALVMEEAPGHTLNAEFRRHGRPWNPSARRATLAEHARRVGLWVQRFQELTASPEDPAPRLAELRSEIHDFLRTLEARDRIVFPAELARGIREFVDGSLAAARGASIRVAGATGEISPENMLIHDGRVTFVDFGMYSLRPVHSDPAMFYQHLHTMRLKPLYHPALVRALKDAFLAGYGRPDLARDRLFQCYRIKYRLSRMEAESGRKWGAFDPARKLFYRGSWRLERRELSRLVSR
jgi:serine/threonine protein kinase